MPSGRYITAGYSCYDWDDCHLDIAIYALTADIDRCEGLCGNYNGDPSDDPTLKDSVEIDDGIEPIAFTNSYM